MEQLDQKLHLFTEEERNGIPLPEKFTFPFYYEPHPLTILAANKLQDYLETHPNLNHNFGLDPQQQGLPIGKMFGVLVIQDPQGQIGYLWAFSGKLANSNNHQAFVPPVFDMLTEESFFLAEEQILNNINAQIETHENDKDFIKNQKDLEKYTQESVDEIASFKIWMKENKAKRNVIRNSNPSPEIESQLIRESNLDQFKFRMLKESWKQALQFYQSQIDQVQNQIEHLKAERKHKSAQLQNQLFAQYEFLNTHQQKKSLGEIFAETIYEKPPAGAGECATPKLLQFAFKHQLKPLAMAEFWWGASPKSEVRKHKHFYPACNGKCRPILKHMLQGIEVEDNPLIENLAEDKQLKIVYEDEFLIVVNKPAELLSVPGIEIQDSVYTRLQELLNPTEPLILHRLDMSTSGLLVVAKTKETHKNIQHQFLKHKVQKRYTALLDGIVENDEGIIELPLRGDFDDRPRQLVCFQHGKKAITQYKVIDRDFDKNLTRIHFWPKTGRTHQLRMHSAHNLGLNSPIIGDDLYGKPANRLHLHAAYLAFTHPNSKNWIEFEVKEDF